VLGTVTTKVKIGKFQPNQEFLVVEGTIAGYDCLLGQDFLSPNGVAIVYSPSTVSVYFSCEDDILGPKVLHRSLTNSTLTKAKYGVGVTTSGKVTLPISYDPTLDRDAEVEPESRKSSAKIRHDISCGKQVAYRVLVTAVDQAAPPQADPVPTCVQKIIDKHSGPNGTLCGTIPPHTHAKGYECHIELIPGAGPVNIRQYRLTPLEKEELMKQIDAFIKKGWIELSSSNWSSSVLFVPKPNNKLRFCVDYRQLNERTVRNQGPIPHQGELLDQLKGANYFSALDLASGYYQLALSKESRAMSAFPTPLGLYQWTVMPMGLCNAPAIFQQAMNQILRVHIAAGYCLVYLDDIIIKSGSPEEHAKHVDAVLSSLTEHRLFCQLPKCTWAQKELKYLGHLVSGEGVKPDPAKVAALDRWQPPLGLVAKVSDPETPPKEVTVARKQIASECRRFLGFMNYFNRFIPKYSALAVCLHEQTQIEAPPWTEECTAAWKFLKDCLSKATLMRHPDFTKPFHVFSDASIRSIGGVLMQYHGDKLCPVAYCARKLSSAEINYTTTEQEMLAMVYCFMQWRCYLEGSDVILHTDHEPLTWLQKQARPNRRQARWLEFFSRFQYQLLYVKGDDNVVADALSRTLELHSEPPQDLPCEHWPDLVVTFTRRRNARATGSGSCAVQHPAPFRVSGDPGRTVIGLGTDGGGGKEAPGGVRGRPTESGKPDRSHDSPHRQQPTPAGLIGALHRVAAGGYTRARSQRKDTPTDGCHVGGDVSELQGSTAEQRGRGVPKTPVVQRKAEAVHVPGIGGTNSYRKSRGKPVTRRVSWRNPLVVDRVVRVRNSESNPDHIPTEVPCVPSATAPEVEGNKFDQVRWAESGPLAPSEPGDLKDHQQGPDPSLSSFELLHEQLYERIRKCLITDQATLTDDQRARLKLRMEFGLLWKDHFLYVPDDIELKYDILYWHHDVPWCGHLGIEKTLELVKRQFYWPGMEADIKAYIQSCYKCQADKPDRRIRRPPLSPIASPSECWRVVGVDMIVNLPPTDDGNDAIVVFGCHNSKMVRPIATQSTLDAEGFAWVYFKEIFPHYGMPERIISDRGPQWNSEFFKALCDLADIRLNLSTAYHPQTNGLIERSNEVIETALRHFVAPDHKNWDRKLPFVEFALNSAYRKSLGCSPFHLNRITLPIDPFRAVISNVAKHEHKQATSEKASWMGMSIPSGERTYLEAQQQFQWARQCVELSKQKMKERHDSKGVASHLYESGQKVWMSMKNVALRHPSRRGKFTPRFIGPLTVLETVGRNAVRLDLPASLGIHSTVSVSLIKPFLPRLGVIPPVNINDELEWEVEAVTSHNLLKSRRKDIPSVVEFKVQWKGNYETSWHEFVDFEHSVETVEAYIYTCPKSIRLQIGKALKESERAQFSKKLQNMWKQK
jgi:hypothetical protein